MFGPTSLKDFILDSYSKDRCVELLKFVDNKEIDKLPKELKPYHDALLWRLLNERIQEQDGDTICML